MSLVVVENLTKRFGGWGKSREVLKGVSFSVEEGEILALLGPNGVGKTTTLKILVGLVSPSGGRVEVCGGSPRRAKVRELIGYVPEERTRFRGLTGEEVASLWRTLYRSWNEKLFGELIATFGVPLDLRTDKYSLGMLTQLLLALALSSRPRLLVFDEPTFGLDPVKREAFLGVLWKVVREEKTAMIFASHELYEVETIADKVAVIVDGKVVLYDYVDNIKGTHALLPMGGLPESAEILTEMGDDLILVRHGGGVVSPYPVRLRDIVIGYIKAYGGKGG